jgi:hypothetical protein
MAVKNGNTGTAKATSIAASKTVEKSGNVNPLIDEDSIETLENARGVITFPSFTAGHLADGGSNGESTRGLTMILDCAAQAVDHATRELESKVVNHGE